MASPSMSTPAPETPADPQPSTAASTSAQPPSNDLELVPALEPSTSALAHLRPVLPEHTLSYSAPPSLIDPRHVRADASGLSAGAYTPLCPSARTSYTRVDGTATPRVPGEHESALGADDDNEDEDGEDEGDGVEERGDEVAAREEPTQEPVPQIPQVALTFLLVSGRRRTMSFEPETTVGRVKELVWNAWPNDWQDERPPAPSYLRILYLGKILQDDDTLQQLNFPVHAPVLASPTPPLPAASIPATPVASTSVSLVPADAHTAAPAPTIVHLSIRAYAPPAEDAPKKRRLRASSAVGAASTEDGEGAGCCGCVVM
ncbi:hypothetical protein CERSUDRAFT_100789 [Gelatoporia subvermispora B]|uniref:Ubiquitin-like domain-containing protein n=1 Tax=Ceriporiopsis subvermispora (strain B) TaxID=914234 RepID=M2QG46_CERS8|nr:hypothetical protein CERSUDRAFT_100789 [Gelatoporia subvermispora B]